MMALITRLVVLAILTLSSVSQDPDKVARLTEQLAQAKAEAAASDVKNKRAPPAVPAKKPIVAKPAAANAVPVGQKPPAPKQAALAAKTAELPHEPVIVEEYEAPVKKVKTNEEAAAHAGREVVQDLVKEIKEEKGKPSNKPVSGGAAKEKANPMPPADQEETGDDEEENPYSNFELSDEDFAVFEEVVKGLGDDFDPSHILTFAVGPGKEECLYEDITQAELVAPEDSEDGQHSTLAGALFMSGGSGRDINFKIMNPSGKLLDNRLLAREASFTAYLTEPGTYELCFGNKMSRVSKKVVTVAFHFEKPKPPVDHLKTEDLLPIGVAADRILHQMQGLQKELIFMDHRYKGLYKSQVALGTRAWFSTAMECIVVVVVAFAQILYIRHIVEKGQPLLGYPGM